MTVSNKDDQKAILSYKFISLNIQTETMKLTGRYEGWEKKKDPINGRGRWTWQFCLLKLRKSNHEKIEVKTAKP